MKALKFFAPNIVKTFTRFPLSVLCSIIVFMIALPHVGAFDPMKGFVMYFICGYFVFGIARLAAETCGWNSFIEGISGIVGSLAAWVIISYSGSVTNYALIMAVFVLAVLSVPFLGRRYDDLSFWNFQQQISTGFIMAVLGAVILAGGISIGMVSVQYLFGIKWSPISYSYIWLFTSLVYAPFNMLSWVPEKYQAEPADCHASPGLPFILNWILAPLAFLYFLILYMYGAKILIEWNLPRGNVAYMVTGFGALGILIYISGWIMRDTGSALLKYLYKHFFSLLILPVILLFIGIGTRIAQYGFTEQRYLVLLLAVWMGGVALFYTFKPNAPIKLLLSSLMCLLLLSSFGPWGAVSFSEHDQVSRLKAVLAKNNMLENGVAVAAKADVPYKDRSEISSIIDYLAHARRTHALHKILPGVDEKQRYIAAQTVMNQLNIRYVSTYRHNHIEEGDKAERKERVYFRTIGVRKSGVDVRGYDYLFQNLSISSKGPLEGYPLDRENDVLKNYALFFRDGNLVLKSDKGETVLLPKDELQKFVAENNLAAKAERGNPLVTEKEVPGAHVKLTVYNGSADDLGNGQYDITDVSMSLLLRCK